MQELVRVIKGSYYIRSEHKKRLEELHAKIGRGTKGIYLIFYSIQNLETFKEEFSFPEDFLIVLQEFARDQNFVHYTTSTDLEMSIKSGLSAKRNGFLGEGIYCVHEDDFLNNGIGDYHMNQLIRTYQKQRFGFYTGSSMIVFKYTGPIMTVINGKGKTNMVRAMVHAIPEGRVVSVFEETISYVVA